MRPRRDRVLDLAGAIAQVALVVFMLALAVAQVAIAASDGWGMR